MKIPHVSQQGYTLVEMMLALTLASMLALSGGLAWRHYQHHAQLDRAARQVADFLQRVQYRAAWGNHHYRIRVQTGQAWSLVVSEDAHSRHGPRAAMAVRWQAPAADIRLDISAPGYLTLAGLRNTATPAHLTLSNPAGSIKIILSGKGRIRICGERGRWAGIAPC